MDATGGLRRSEGDEVCVLIVLLLDSSGDDAKLELGKAKRHIALKMRLASADELPVAVGLRQPLFTITDELEDGEVTVNGWQVETITAAVDELV